MPLEPGFELLQRKVVGRGHRLEAAVDGDQRQVPDLLETRGNGEVSDRGQMHRDFTYIDDLSETATRNNFMVAMVDSEGNIIK